MGSFAKSLAGILFGWVSDVISRIWSLFSTDSGTDSVPWIGKHWLLIVILLCVIGLIVDFTVYLNRWKPYKVWASFFRRHHGDCRGDLTTEDAGTGNAEEVQFPYTMESDRNDFEPEEERGDRDAVGAPVQMPEKQTVSFISKQTEQPVQEDPYASYRRPEAETVREMSESGTETADRWQTENTFERERRESYRRNTQDTPRRRIVRNFLGDDDSDEFTPRRGNRPRPVIDREDAYREPVYPPQWKQNQQSGDNEIHG